MLLYSIQFSFDFLCEISLLAGCLIVDYFCSVSELRNIARIRWLSIFHTKDFNKVHNERERENKNRINEPLRPKSRRKTHTRNMSSERKPFQKCIHFTLCLMFSHCIAWMHLCGFFYKHQNNSTHNGCRFHCTEQ